MSDSLTDALERLRVGLNCTLHEINDSIEASIKRLEDSRDDDC